MNLYQYKVKLHWYMRVSVMAILNGGINGGFSGKAGPVVGYYRLGKWCMRAMPKKSSKNKRGTPAQKESRSTFTKTQQFLSPILSFIRVGFNMEARAKQMTAHNLAKSYNMLNAFTPEGEIDYSKAQVSFGKLPGAADLVVEKDDIGLHFSWKIASSEKLSYSSDQVMLLAFDETAFKFNKETKPSDKEKEAYYIVSGARRKAGIETLEIPAKAKGHVLHTYLAFISDDRERVSMSAYTGEIVY